MTMTVSRFRILLAEAFDAPAIEKLRSVGDVVCLEAHDAATLRRAVADCDALLVRTASEVSQAVIDAATRLKVIGRGGVGLENIDLDAARRRGIAVVYTPAASTDAVADLTIGFLIALVRNFREVDAEIRAGRFAEARRSSMAPDLSEQTLGIVGLGRIGRAVARRARQAFGMRIIYNDIVAPGWLDFVATPVSKEELWAHADVVSLHVPLTEQTRNLIDAAALARFKQGGCLINTARGAVVDGLALAEALRDGRLGGAALDVFDPEPLPAEHPLLQTPRTLFTPHLGARTTLGLARMNSVVEDVIRVLRNQAPLHPAWE